MMSPRLNAEQRRALAVLADAGHTGATQALLSFEASMIAELARSRARDPHDEKVRAGGKLAADCQLRCSRSGLILTRGARLFYSPSASPSPSTIGTGT
jgi:hypothetical protein